MPPIFQCDYCEFYHRKKGTVQVHSRKAHDKHFLPYKCKRCGKKYGKIENFRDHLKADICKKPRLYRKGISKTKPPKVPVLCKFCNKWFPYNVLLRKHVLTMHKEANELSTCDICFLKCSNIFTLKNHKIQKHQSGKFKVCMYCDVKRLHSWQLKYHIEITHPEHGKKKHLCDVCGKGFIFETICQSHKRERHTKHVCHICGIEYGCSISLKEHLIHVHKEKKLSRDLVCETCGFSTPSKKMLTRHIRFKHAVDKHSKCPHCDYHTPRPEALHVHMDSKHQQHYTKQFFCDDCRKGFAFENSLKKHLGNKRLMAMNRAKKEVNRLKNLVDVAT